MQCHCTYKGCAHKPGDPGTGLCHKPGDLGTSAHKPGDESELDESQTAPTTTVQHVVPLWDPRFFRPGSGPFGVPNFKTAPTVT